MISKREIEVSYSDTDMMGIVYHGSYIVYFEFGRTKFLKDMGFNMKDCIQHKLVFPVVDVNLKYLKPTKYGDEVVVHTKIHSFNKTSTTYIHEVYANNELSVSGHVKLAHVDTDTFKPVNISKVFPNLYKKYCEVEKYG